MAFVTRKSFRGRHTSQRPDVNSGCWPHLIAQRTSVAALGTLTEMDVWGPFTFERLLKLPKSDVYAFVCVASVTYEDGSTQQFE